MGALPPFHWIKANSMRIPKKGFSMGAASQPNPSLETLSPDCAENDRFRKELFRFCNQSDAARRRTW